MNLEEKLPRSRRRTKWFWPVLAVIAVLILAVIVVPVAIVVPKQSFKSAGASVILPLYIYPIDNSSWGPVHTA
jgi:NADH:ubiquinone oxidoreductase subunit 6 (subunit J)